MDYKTYRPSIQSGDLLAWTTSKPSKAKTGWTVWMATKIIRIFTASEYCHVGIAWVVGDRVFVVEAVNPMVRVFPLSNELPCFHLPMKVTWSDELLSFLLERVGEKYSILEALRAYFSRPQQKGEWECGELVNRFYKKANIDLGEAWTPSEVVMAALAHHDKDEVVSIRYVE